jgi:acylphosphatase
MVFLSQIILVIMAEKARLSLIINGRVQGVFFRLKTQQVALAQGLTGWVRNNPDGSVECLAEGDKDKLEEFIKWCQQGPDRAEVVKVDATWQSYTGEFNDFIIK